MSRLNDLDNADGTPFPPSRLTCHDDARSYYTFCRATPEDLLSSITNASRPVVLLLGAGDARSIFYTLYRNFDPEFRGRFEGANFIVNENWAVLQARDILLLYLCLQLPHKIECEEGKLLCAAIWAISFCHTLHTPHVEILNNALDVLTKFSSTPDEWASPNNPLGRIVKFTNPKSFHDISRHWKQWSTDRPKNVPTVTKIKDLRTSFLSCLHKMPLVSLVSKYPEQCLTRLLGLSADVIPKKRQTKMADDFVEFLETGTVFVEDMLDLAEDKAGPTTPNVTFFDGTSAVVMNNPFYGLVPFLGFFHSFVFSPSDCHSGNVARSLIDKLPVKDDKFEQHPLVANSVQQLVFWLAASSRALRKLTAQTSPDITFVFECSDPIVFCLRMLRDPEVYTTLFGVPPQFDIIHTFQMIDSISPPDLLLHAAPLLKTDAFMFATSVRYQHLSYTLDRFLGSIFGVHPQIFPVMYGIRCLGVEATYSDCTLPRHVPWSHVKRHDKADSHTFVFKRLSFSPFKVECLQDFDFAPRAVNSCTHAAVYDFPTNIYANMMCMETVVTTLLTFIAQMDEDTPVDRWEFWQEYTSSIKDEVNLFPFHNHLQAIAMLHNLHLHIVVDERDCPLCRYRPLSTYIAQFSVEVTNPNLSPETALAVFLGKSEISLNNFLENAKNTHCVHAITLRRDENERLFLEFFYQRSYAETNYRLTVLRFPPTQSGNGKTNVPSIVYEGWLGEHIIKGSRYNFRPLPPRQRSLSTPFGDMGTNVSECDKIKTIINMDPRLVYKVGLHGLNVSSAKITHWQLRLKCDYWEYDIHYPYTVQFESMRVEFDYKTSTATATAPRDQQAFYEEMPLFVVTSSSRLFLPACPVFPSPSRDYLHLQMNTLENETLRRTLSSVLLPVLRLKHTLRDLFQLVPQCRFIHIHTTSKEDHTPKLQGMLVVHDEVVDLDTRCPAIDLSYCFLEKEEDDRSSAVTTAWTKMTADHMARVLTVDSDLLFFIKKMFGYYANRTHTVFSDNNRTSLCRIKVLRKHNVEGSFTRAVVFPMFGSPDNRFEDQTAVREPEESPVRYIAGMIPQTQDSGYVNRDLRRVIETLRPPSQPKQQDSAGGTSVNVTGTTAFANLGNEALLQLLQGISGSGLITLSSPPIVVGSRTPQERSGKRRGYTKVKDGMRRKSAAATKAAANKTTAPKVRESKEKAREKLREKAREKARKMVNSDDKEEAGTETKDQKTSLKKKESSQETAVATPTTTDTTADTTLKTSSEGAAISIDDGILEDDLEEKSFAKSKHRWNGKDSSRSKGKCTNCGESSEHMKKCAGCGKTRYCSRECQKHHWKQHKPHCTQENSSKMVNGERVGKRDRGSTSDVAKQPMMPVVPPATGQLKCQTCGKTSDTLKRCKCYTVSYCDVQCQRQDWPRHKKTCSAAPNTRVSRLLTSLHV